MLRALCSLLCAQGFLLAGLGGGGNMWLNHLVNFVIGTCQAHAPGDKIMSHKYKLPSHPVTHTQAGPRQDPEECLGGKGSKGDDLKVAAEAVQLGQFWDL